MSEKGNSRIGITKPGVLAFGKGLPVGSDLTTFFQDETVVQVSCGKYHSAVVCESGRVYIFEMKQHDGRINICSGPILFQTISKDKTVRIAQVAFGEQFIMFLSDQGKLYECVVNYPNQQSLNAVSTPKLCDVNGLPPIKKVAAAFDHTMVLTVSGEVWWRSYNIIYGQLGYFRVSQMRNQTFTRVPNLAEPVIDISCGGSHAALITASRVLLMIVRNNQQFSLSEVNSLTEFKPVSLGPSTGVAAVSCGRGHTVALGTDGTTWAWGINGSGLLGTGDSYQRFTPTKMIGLEDQTISQVIAGCHHTAVLTQEGDVFVCGDVNRGELGLGMKHLLTATLVPKSSGLVVQQVAFSEKHFLLLVTQKSDAKAAPQFRNGITEKVNKAESDITNLERSFMKSLECPVCFMIMSSPIHLCINGHNLCGSCLSDTHITVCPVCRGQFMAGRNIALENLSAEMKLPCTDCLERMPVVELNKHGEVCPQRKYDCPVQQHSCGWSGQLDKMLAHTTSAHPDQTWRDLPHLFVHSLSDGLVHTDLLAAHDQVFTLHRKYHKKAKKFLTALRYIGPPENAHKFIFEFKFIKDHINNSYRRNVCVITESVEDIFLSPNRVAIRNKMLDSFLQQGCLVCRVAILKVETSELADQIKTLLQLNVNASTIQDSPLLYRPTIDGNTITDNCCI